MDRFTNSRGTFLLFIFCFLSVRLSDLAVSDHGQSNPRPDNPHSLGAGRNDGMSFHFKGLPSELRVAGKLPLLSCNGYRTS